jgi:hypothetical protein
MMHVSAQLTEQHQGWVEIATTALTGGYATIPLDAGPYPTITQGQADYGQPVPRVTWRRNLPPPTPLTCKVCKPPYKHHSAQVRG